MLDISDTGHAPSPIDDRYRRITTPAVDMSDPGDGPRTDTVLAVMAPLGDDSDPDPDIDAATDAQDAEASGANRAR